MLKTVHKPRNDLVKLFCPYNKCKHNYTIRLAPDTQQLQLIADEIVNGGHPYKILDDIRQNKSNS